MAINYGNYAQLYGGGADYSGLAKGLASIPGAIDASKQKEWNKWSEAEWSGITEPLWNSTLQDVAPGPDGILMPNFKFKNPGEAYVDFKAGDVGGEFKHKDWALGKGLFNAPQFMKQYEAYISSYTPMIESKLLRYKDINNLTDKEFATTLAKNPNLRDYLVKYSKNPNMVPLLEHQKTNLQEWDTWGKEWKEKMNWLKSPEGLPYALAGGPLVYTALKYAPNILSAAGKIPGVGRPFAAAGRGLTSPTGTYGNVPQTALATTAMYYGSKGSGNLTKKLSEMAGGSEKDQKLAREYGEIAGTGLSSILGRRGVRWALKVVGKKAGYGLVARTLGKGILSVFGGAFSGGVVTAAMAGWTIKDIYDIMQILQEEDAKLTTP